MKIALLNLQYDNNYGGNLQRYALMKVLKDLGHKPKHLNLRFDYLPQVDRDYKKLMLKRIVMRCLGKYHGEIRPEYKRHRKYMEECSVTECFYNKYVDHTSFVYNKEQLKRKCRSYDAYIVGSDQVWRKSIAAIHGIDTFFFDFLDEQEKRIAYGASLGSDVNELLPEDIERLTPLYKRFSDVSVRESSGLKLLEQYGWNAPKPIQVLDPTLLLSADDYRKIICKGNTRESQGDMFCYILDPCEEKNVIIAEEAEKRGLTPFVYSITDSNVSVEQWLRSFDDSAFVVTDSYHGVVFSIIFNKPFRLIRNSYRGNSRFDSLFELLDITDPCDISDWSNVNSKVKEMQKKSVAFLKDSLDRL